MTHLVKSVKNIKVKTLFIAIFAIWLLSWAFTFFFVDQYHFHKISDRSIAIQKECLDHFLSTFRTHKVPIILFDIDIMPNLFQLRPKSWHNSDHKCKTLCKYHPEEKNVITFAIQGTKIEGKENNIINDLKKLGYAVHMSMDVDPRLFAIDGTVSLIPTYLWVAKNDHVIHIAFLHERLGSYMWIGPVRDSDWKETVDVLAPALSDGWHSMERIGAKFPRYAQAMDKSQRFLGYPLEIDGHRLNIPYHMRELLAEYRESEFIECNFERAREYKLLYESDLSNEEIDFKNKAKQLILKSKDVLDKLNIPFWLSSGTCLGWYRQCDIIPYSVDVDFGIMIYNYSLKIIEAMHDAGMSLVQKLGKADDSLELSFIGEENIKLDLFFFYEEKDYFWNGGTQVENGEKYKYKFPKFKLCWTEFLQIKIRVPCNPQAYIEANYGKDWDKPVRDWQWNYHPPNLQPNGKWSEQDQDVAIQLFEKSEKHSEALEEIRQVVKAQKTNIKNEVKSENIIKDELKQIDLFQAMFADKEMDNKGASNQKN